MPGEQHRSADLSHSRRGYRVRRRVQQVKESVGRDLSGRYEFAQVIG